MTSASAGGMGGKPPLLPTMRQNISGGSPYEPIIGFSRAVRVGNTVHLAGTGPVGADNEDAAGQTRRIFAIAKKALAEAGASFEDVVRTRMYLTHVEDWEADRPRSRRVLRRHSSRCNHGRGRATSQSGMAH